MIGGGKALSNPKVIIGIIVSIIILYIVLAAIFKWWPFHEKGNDGSGNGQSNPSGKAGTTPSTNSP